MASKVVLSISTSCKGWKKQLLSCVVAIWLLFPVVLGHPEPLPHEQGHPQDPYDLSHNHLGRRLYGHQQYHPLKTPISSLHVNGPYTSRYENRYIRDSVAKDQQSQLQPASTALHQERSYVTHRSAGSQISGYEQIIHSIVIEGKFGKEITRVINRTSEYLIEFIYNATELEVSQLTLR